MSSNEMLKILKKRKIEVGIIQLTNELGYRSVNTILSWFNNNRVPTVAVARVQKYINLLIKGKTSGNIDRHY